MSNAPGTSTINSMADVWEAYRAELDGVEHQVRQNLDSSVTLVNTVAAHILSSGGKRVRPLLLLLSARLCGYAGREHHQLGSLVEFIHTATLLHDDVVDASGLRRGRSTADAEFGNATAGLVGDFLYSRAFQMMVGVGSMRVMQVLADATNVIAEGEVLQLMNMHQPDVALESYLQVIRYKTAKLFEASARLGAVLACAPREVEEAFVRALAEVEWVIERGARVVVMRAGRIVEQGTSEQVLGSPKHDYTRELLTAIPHPPLPVT